MFQGETITLRPFEPSDSEALLSYLNHTKMSGQRGLPGRFPTHAPLTATHMDDLLDGYRSGEHGAHLAVVLNGIDTVIGHAGVYNRWDAHAPDVFVTVGPSHARQNVYEEAYRLLLHYVFTTTLAHNVSTYCPEFASDCIASLKAIGFEEAGRERRSGIHQGQFFDELAFDILRPEWEEKENA